MPDIFSSGPGRVTQLVGGGLPMTLTIGNTASNNFYDAWRGFTGFKSVITGLAIQEQSAVQFLHTLRQFIYVYTFGERIADVSINGLSFMANCQDNFAANPAPVTGLEYLVSFYRVNRIGTSGVPLAINIGSFISFWGFLVGLRAEIVEPGTGLAQFSMAFRCPP